MLNKISLLILLFITSVCSAQHAAGKRTILFVGAHPDDETAISEVLHKYARLGNRFYPKEKSSSTIKHCMKNLFTLVFTLIISLPCFTQTLADSTAIKELIKNDYIALGKSDIDSHIKNCAPGYVLIEDGAIWDLKREIEYMKSKSALHTIRKDTFDFKSLVIDSSFAYTVYKLKSTIEREGVIKSYTWTESAVFKKISDSWKIQLIHSTQLTE